ncbi:MAG TPA: response regulator transcription factor [Acidimicrobiales bacterium]|nr:response regulator transcription factor [Acidimicrobiales bacterium]
MRWNSAADCGTVDFREQPTWSYYSQVSVAGARVTVDERALAARGSARRISLHPSVGSLPAAFEQPGLPSALGSRRGDDKQWGPWSLTQRELEVIQLLAEGATNSEISDRLYISPKTTKNHLAAIFQKLDVSNRTQALVRAVVMGLVNIE